MPPKKFARRSAAEETVVRGDRPGPTGVFGLSNNFPRVVEIDTDRISPNPSQPRRHFDEEALASLANSIERDGLLQPITVQAAPEKPGHYILVAGERRWRAHQLLERPTIFAIVTEGNAHEIALIENVQRVDLDGLELAHGYAKLMSNHGYSVEEVGQVVGLDEGRVRRTLSILGLPQSILDEYAVGYRHSVSRSVLEEIAAVSDPSLQAKLWEQAKAGGGLTVRGVREAKRNADETEDWKRRRSLETSIGKVAKTITLIREARDTLDDGQRQRLRSLRDQIDELLT
ncbi:ParB/RepB/Spo0J family partition protein [Azospirillum sp. sgz302134]